MLLSASKISSYLQVGFYFLRLSQSILGPKNFRTLASLSPTYLLTDDSASGDSFHAASFEELSFILKGEHDSFCSLVSRRFVKKKSVVPFFRTGTTPDEEERAVDFLGNRATPRHRPRTSYMLRLFKIPQLISRFSI